MGFNFDKLQPGGLRKQWAVAAWNFGNNLSICLNTE
jgi:hypothetical protein